LDGNRDLAAMSSAIVLGASGAIGGACVRLLCDDPRYDQIYALSRTPPPSNGKLIGLAADICHEISLIDAAGQIDGEVRLILIATGILHDGALQPEKSWRALDPTNLTRLFQLNTIGPALALKALVPLLPRAGPSRIAALSARVGSISDNRLGGWYGYRASKAALNQLLKCLSIEFARTHPEAVVAGLHPGTVASALSAPFQRGVAEAKLFTPDYSAAQLLGVLDQLTPVDSGGLYAWDGTRIAF
jgi:NAD(P)-dependent dehydrogenase (short-subunit alcohol dehydrogenase family)